MAKWSEEIEEEITLLIKDWLKQHNKTQKDLKNGLHANSERMPALLEILKKEFSQGGLHKLAAKLCEIENQWSTNHETSSNMNIDSDPFGQLDLLLEEIEEDCNN